MKKRITSARNWQYAIVGYENLPLNKEQIKHATAFRKLGFEAVWYQETSGHTTQYGQTTTFVSDDSDLTFYVYRDGRINFTTYVHEKKMVEKTFTTGTNHTV